MTAEQKLYEVWLPGQDQPAHILADGDRAARIARDQGGVFVEQGASEEDRQALFDLRAPALAPVTGQPMVDVLAGQARTRTQYDAIEEKAASKAKASAEKAATKAVDKAESASAKTEKPASAEDKGSSSGDK